MVAAPSFLTASLAVALGGGAGAWLRFVLTRAIDHNGFPWATLLANISGSFAMGLLASWLARAGSDGEGWRLFLGVGLLGGFTTFSAFSLELVTMAQRGSAMQALGYVVVSVGGAALGLLAGLAAARLA